MTSTSSSAKTTATLTVRTESNEVMTTAEASHLDHETCVDQTIPQPEPVANGSTNGSNTSTYTSTSTSTSGPSDVLPSPQPQVPPVATSSSEPTDGVVVLAMRKLYLFLGVLLLDTVVSVVVLAPIWPYLRHMEDASLFYHYSLHRSLVDLSFLAALRITASVLALLICYCKAQLPPENPRYDHFDKYHPNGDRKTREQLEQEALEEPYYPWLLRFIARPSLSTELFAVLAQSLAIVKCLVRMNVEIGTYEDSHPYHPLFWVAVLSTALLSAIEATYLQDVCNVASRCGFERFGRTGGADGTNAPFRMLRTISSQLLAPLLENEHINGTGDIEQDGRNDHAVTDENDENVRATSDITADPSYKAKWTDLLMMCYPDACMIVAAFVFLLLAAIAQVLIPKYLGNILDALAAAFGNPDDQSNRHISMWDVPHFMSNVKLLVIASILAGVFAGLRGSIFTVVGARTNVRLRVKLMDALLSQDIGFFDITKTGDITSRLSSDTTLVGDQIAMNVNVFLRSLVQAAGVLFFMLLVSWQLTILAFISVPLITLLSTWYGSYVRALTKVMQQKLADGNSVSEAALGSMSTVRAFDAAENELSAFEVHMKKYLNMNLKSAVAYYGYATLSVAIPELIFAIVVFYGGMLVRNGDMTSGKLVSFLLYLQSLSDAFSTIGWVFSSLTQAVGAADKVFELMHRQPKITRPSTTSPPCQRQSGHIGILGIEAIKTREQRLYGVRPDVARGEIVLENVKMYYPARPKRCVLNGLSLKIDAGSIVALVGQSGGGKSSVMSLIQHLYEPSSGRVLFDGVEIHELSPEWLSRHICIVSQEPTLFARSIKQNIMYGLEGTDAEPSDEEIVAAAQLANADSFIQNMPQKYETEVGERGVQLSGGQKQRIAIARALVRKPKVLLLDEATSALDAESEHLVQQAIDDMIERGKSEGGNNSMTVIIVAHRLSTVRSADRIFVIKEGQVVEEGSHEELIGNPNGAYTSLIKRQMQAQQSIEPTTTEGSS